MRSILGEPCVRVADEAPVHVDAVGAPRPRVCVLQEGCRTSTLLSVRVRLGTLEALVCA